MGAQPQTPAYRTSTPHNKVFRPFLVEVEIFVHKYYLFSVSRCVFGL